MNKLTGIVVCGGKSSRMGADKSLLDYHGRPQRYFVSDMLRKYCGEVFISCNADQADDIIPGYPFITDLPEYADQGPMGALLSAYKQLPGMSFVFIGCDYPFIEEGTIAHLIEAFRAGTGSICCFENDEGFPEPLLAVYDASLKEALMQHYEDDTRHSLNTFIRQTGWIKVVPFPPGSTMSIDTPGAYQAAKQNRSMKEPSQTRLYVTVLAFLLLEIFFFYFFTRFFS